MNIINHEAEKLEDPFNILSGTRYEFYLELDIPEDDELFQENGLYVKLILVIEEDSEKITQYQLYEKNTNKYVDFELDEEELTELLTYCKKQLSKPE
ncbi:pullulanase [Bacillus lacus]|uniref:Pullulanase n=1 Tax=Metabacillus lacus TaxID=1983721 RepID=A0A7X2IY37_9BACI|nr:DUF6509 family protein [Metabacillus lacus]MRX71592.1 pullulanase [Metabacillus lacus]